MPIIDTFDGISKEIINPKEIIAPIDGFPETVLVTFSHKFNDLIMKKFSPEKIDVMTGGREIPLYKFTYNNKKLGFYHTLLGGSASAGLLEEVIAKGGRKFLFWGSCGSLDKDITSGHIVVPTAAYRDEGASYHYLPTSDFVDIETAGKTAEILESLCVPCVKTKTWTTDSFYRETENNVEARKQTGCAVVEMECASVMAVGKFRGVSVHQFLYAADCLDGNAWDQRILGSLPDDMRETILKIALETAVRL